MAARAASPCPEGMSKFLAICVLFGKMKKETDNGF